MSDHGRQTVAAALEKLRLAREERWEAANAAHWGSPQDYAEWQRRFDMTKAAERAAEADFLVAALSEYTESSQRNAEEGRKAREQARADNAAAQTRAEANTNAMWRSQDRMVWLTIVIAVAAAAQSLVPILRPQTQPQSKAPIVNVYPAITVTPAPVTVVQAAVPAKAESSGRKP